jgi:hypothetical protein
MEAASGSSSLDRTGISTERPRRRLYPRPERAIPALRSRPLVSRFWPPVAHRDHIEGPLCLALDHQQPVRTVCAQSVGVVERPRGLQPGNSARAAVGTDRDAIEPVTLEDVRIDAAIGQYRDAVELRSGDVPARVMRPDLEAIEPGFMRKMCPEKESVT